MKAVIRRLIQRIVMVLSLSWAFGAMVSAGGQQVRPSGVPEGPAPTAQAIETASAVRGSFRPSVDLPMARPAHPPIDQIPPMPMRRPPADAERQVSGVAAAPVVYDIRSRTSSVLAQSAAASSGEHAAGAGYDGADGGDTGGYSPSTMFGSMTLLNAATRATFPHRMNVKLVMRFGSSFFVCSGTMRDAEVVLTAGHCVYDFGGSGWADEIWVYPAWDGNNSIVPPSSTINPFGWGYATELGSNTGWTGSGSFDFDSGYVEIDRAVGMLTGWFGWSTGGSCAYWQGTDVRSGSYPAEGCGVTGLHNGRGMYFWTGRFDVCFGNQLQLNTVPGCLNAIWGGQSGSGVYETISGNHHVHGITSRSDRSSVGLFVRQWTDWVNFGEVTFVPGARGAAFDLQPLDMNVGTATIAAGGTTTTLSHLLSNPTNGAASGNWTFDVYLSTNDNIDPTDTFLSSQTAGVNFSPMQSWTINMAAVMIPANTPPGTYWIGVIYDNGQDTNNSNNDTDGWDAVQVTVVAGQADLVVSSVAAPPLASPGSTFSVSTTVANTGGQNAGSFTVGLYLSADSLCTTGDTPIGSYGVGGLAAAGSATRNVDVTIPAATPLSSRFVCAIADTANAVGEASEANNSGFDPIDIVSATPTVTLRVNGVDAPNVTTTGPFHLTLDIGASTVTAPVDWYWALVYDGTLFWVTSTGLSTVPTPLVTAPPSALTNVTLLNISLPPGTTITTGILLADGGTSLSFDVITANVTTSAPAGGKQ